ncbi:Xaa-Pro dipeptidase [Halomonas chromatireducens]|uniref:Xaa-Pro dipeptidase n=1 Tax=Halomonas chromatireducens TaxID=507626 RepID=A0A0X8HED7_9GAMM|nr:Xaa-Pro dipeptidase [Halomonas chromatireducens]AMD00965.1 Xaa-Pro dipeptidase [Halomonas chromatireducens]
MTDPLAELQRGHLDWLEQRYAETLSRLGYDGVLIFSGQPALHFGDDQHASFQAYGHFQHWTGQAYLTHSWLLVCPGNLPVLYLHSPDDFWHLPASLPQEAWTERVEVVKGRFDVPPALPRGRYAVIGDVDVATAGALGADPNPEALLMALDEGRVRKSEYEVACIGRANRQAMAGHIAARDAFLSGAAELDVQLAYLQASRQRESQVPYGNIVGINAHGGVLHYQHYDTLPPKKQRSLLVDAGHRYHGYCADITRTWAGGQADEVFPPLIKGVAHIQQQLIAAIRPGVDYAVLHEQMHELLAALLVEHRIVLGSPESAVANGITRAFCPHGLGHLLGIQVHDVAGRRAANGMALPPPDEHPALRLTRELEAGMVVTIEPGLYVIPMLLDPLRQGPVGREVNWERVERLAPHGGIRIEDNVLVTSDTAKNLTPEAE